MDAKQRFAELMRDPCFAPGYKIRKEVMGGAREVLDEPETKTLAEENARKMARQ